MLSLKRLWAHVRPVLQFRVKRWHTAMRGWEEQDIRVLICLEDEIWYWVLAEFVAWDCVTRVCDVLHHVPFPKWLRNWERNWDREIYDEPCKFEEYYGDDFSVFWHIWVESPALQFVWEHKNPNAPQFEMTLDEARVKFAHDPDVWKWVEKSLEEHKQYDAEKAAEELAKNSD